MPDEKPLPVGKRAAPAVCCCKRPVSCGVPSIGVRAMAGGVRVEAQDAFLAHQPLEGVPRPSVGPRVGCVVLHLQAGSDVVERVHHR